MKILFIIVQYLTPQHTLSRLLGKLAECKTPWLKNNLIQFFINQYHVDMNEAADSEPTNYKTFNDFFTRPLKEGARPIADEKHTVTCPADGCVSQIGDIEQGRIFQAKGQSYSLQELIGGCEETARQFEGGKFATIYLSPKDYHRVHMPFAGTLRSMTHVPGDLFSVNETSAESISNLFARNERAVCIFDTEIGPMAVIMVGAMIVASIETVWAGQITPIKDEIRTTLYATTDQQPESQSIALNKGDEMGRFKLGSTAIVLFGADVIEWQSYLQANSPVRMGESIGKNS